MKRPKFNQPPGLWKSDGSLRDVYIVETSAREWAALLDLARSYPHEYREAGEISDLPNIDRLFPGPDCPRQLHILVGPAEINCHFFVPQEIELDIDPRQVVDEAAHFGVLRFLERLASGTGRQISLTPENLPERPYLIFDPVQHVWSVRG